MVLDGDYPKSRPVSQGSNASGRARHKNNTAAQGKGNCWNIQITFVFCFFFFYSGALKFFHFDVKKNFISINSEDFHGGAGEKNEGMGL